MIAHWPVVAPIPGSPQGVGKGFGTDMRAIWTGMYIRSGSQSTAEDILMIQEMLIVNALHQIVAEVLPELSVFNQDRGHKSE